MYVMVFSYTKARILLLLILRVYGSFNSIYYPNISSTIGIGSTLLSVNENVL